MRCSEDEQLSQPVPDGSVHARPEPIGTRYRQASSCLRRTPRVCGLSAVALPRKHEEMPLTLTLTRLGPSAPQFPPVTCLSPPAPASVRAFVTPAYAGYVPKLPVATKITKKKKLVPTHPPSAPIELSTKSRQARPKRRKRERRTAKLSSASVSRMPWDKADFAGGSS